MKSHKKLRDIIYGLTVALLEIFGIRYDQKERSTNLS